MQGHEAVEKNVPLLIILIIVAISFGTLVELTPLIFSKQLAEPIDGPGALLGAGTGRPGHLHPRGLQYLPLADGTPPARRDRALRPLLRSR
jgi:hypothetical protein